MDLTREYWGHFNVSVSFLRGSVNSQGHYRAAATSQQPSDKERIRPHGVDVQTRIYDVPNVSVGLNCEWFRTNELRGLTIPSVYSLVWTVEGNLTWKVAFFCLVLIKFVVRGNARLCSISPVFIPFFEHTLSGISVQRKQTNCTNAPESNWTNHPWCERALRVRPVSNNVSNSVTPPEDPWRHLHALRCCPYRLVSLQALLPALCPPSIPQRSKTVGMADGLFCHVCWDVSTEITDNLFFSSGFVPFQKLPSVYHKEAFVRGYILCRWY